MCCTEFLAFRQHLDLLSKESSRVCRNVGKGHTLRLMR